ncbi:hypothetical protein L228DRAFT_128765 [Xylona heveae TC161]|uniref:Uncharacterized protein n=1 Tax=Xylona heveae (strain CBS 132557 / TC161) TaxID=1328760 RepID=A0A165GT70_XYLHT|nr:hypothetical protein L228DRAFT_128765 [Xylona heveae TC161]KZF22567.1 hypothetical protein L228DRAFT_128765 [Xylona heveae TC161]
MLTKTHKVLLKELFSIFLATVEYFFISIKAKRLVAIIQLTRISILVPGLMFPFVCPLLVLSSIICLRITTVVIASLPLASKGLPSPFLEEHSSWRKWTQILRYTRNICQLLPFPPSPCKKPIGF